MLSLLLKGGGALQTLSLIHIFFVAQMYGLTETCGDGAWNSSQEAKYLTSVGDVYKRQPQ